MWNIIKKLNKWYIKLISILLLIIFFLHKAGPPFDLVDLWNAGYVEGIVLDNKTLPDCQWDNKLTGKVNICDQNGFFEIVLKDDTHARMHIYQADTTYNQILFGAKPLVCYGSMFGFEKNSVSPDDSIRLFAKKRIRWVKEDLNGRRGIVTEETPQAYMFNSYSNCDSPLFFIQKVK